MADTILPSVSDNPDWQLLIEARSKTSFPIIKAVTYGGKFPQDTFSSPRIIFDENNHEYVIKAPLVRDSKAHKRTLIVEHVVGRLANSLAAPVPPTVLVDLPANLIESEPELVHLRAGIAHGSRRIPECSQIREDVLHTNVPENRARFVMLSILYGWLHPYDHQWIYANHPPHLVWSVDHGHFVFEGRAEWNEDSFPQRLIVEPCSRTVAACALTIVELQSCVIHLKCITVENIVDAVTAPDASWEITLLERIAFARYIYNCRKQLLLHITQNS